jgi:DNA adenine methylase
MDKELTQRRYMQYLGGKSKIRKEVSTFLESQRKLNQTYFEPFVGGGWILQEMSGKRIASDGNKALVSMYIALQNGWVPPDFVSEDEWRLHRETKNVTDNPMQAFARLGCGFGGDWNGGYARSTDQRCYAAVSKRSLLKQLPLIQDTEFIHGMFTDHTPKNMLVYCDPPYADTTQYGAFSGFDTELFWNHMRQWVTDGNTVVVSEYKAPSDWVCVSEFKSRMGLTTKGGKRVNRDEKLFMHISQVNNSIKGDTCGI